MTQTSSNSGIFTFPATGVWEIYFSFEGWHNAHTEFIQVLIKVSTDYASGPTLAEAALAETGVYMPSGSLHYSASTSTIFNVTDVATHKLKFVQLNQNGKTPTIRGSSTRADTYATFKKLN